MLCVLAAIFLVACNNQKDTQWEYKIVTISENITLQDRADRLAKNMTGRLGYEGVVAINFDDPSSKLNELGKEGWELVSTYTTTETIFPNMGNADYHTGIKENTRTESINFVFKRKMKSSSNNISCDTPSTDSTCATAVVEEMVEFVDTCSYDTIAY